MAAVLVPTCDGGAQFQHVPEYYWMPGFPNTETDEAIFIQSFGGVNGSACLTDNNTAVPGCNIYPQIYYSGTVNPDLYFYNPVEGPDSSRKRKRRRTDSDSDAGNEGDDVRYTVIPSNVMQGDPCTQSEGGDGYCCYQETETCDIPSRVCTPETSPPIDAHLVDSGYEGGVNLQCLETDFDWPEDCLSGTANCVSVDTSVLLSFGHFNTQDQHGFEGYMMDIYHHRLSIEYKYHVVNCLDGQKEVTPSMRGLLVCWMTGVHHQKKLCQDTLFIAVNIVDRTLDIMQASCAYIQLLGITSLLIACKCEEVNPPEITELLATCDETFSVEQVRHMERVLLNALKFDLMVPTAQFFLEHFASCSLTIFGGIKGDNIRKARALARFILELALQDYNLCQHKASKLAYTVWKVAMDETDCCDGDFVPPEVFSRQEEYDSVYNDVLHFTQGITRQNFTDMKNVYDYYGNIYGKE